MQADWITPYFDRMVGLFHAGKPAESIALCEALQAVEPTHPPLLLTYGVLLRDSGQRDRSFEIFRRVHGLVPDSAQAVDAYAAGLLERHRKAEARRVLQAGAGLPDCPANSFLNLAKLLREDGDLAAAERVLTAATARHPDAVFLWQELGLVCRHAGRFAAGIAATRAVVALQPHDVWAYSNLGGMERLAGNPAAATAAHARALSLDPDAAIARYNLALALKETGEWAAAEEHLRAGLALDPGMDDARHHLGMLLLARGAFDEGWREFEYRPNACDLRATLGHRAWDGRSIPGGTLLLITDGGFGDAVQFARYLPAVRARFARLLFAYDPMLERLFRASFPDPAITHLPGRHDPASASALLMSLPHLLSVGKAADQSDVPLLSPPYLVLPDGAAAHWRQRLASHPGPRVALVWAGSDGGQRADRSIPLDRWEPVLAQDGITFVSLQRGPARAQLTQGRWQDRILDWTDELTDFAEIGALLSACDLLISVDTGIVHLAGALAHPVWCLIAANPDFRWERERRDSRLYPSLLLFRQQAGQGWEGAIAEVAGALARLARERRQN